MEIHAAVGQNIQRIRKAEKLSMDRLAQLAGVSKSMLGQIERGTVNPTVDVLGRLAQGLHVPLERLVECREEPQVTLHRGVDITGQRLCGGKVIRYALFPYDSESHSESCQMDIFISGSYAAPDQIPGSMVYVTTLSGTLELEVDGEVYRMESRDSLSFPGSRAYVYRNAGNNMVRLLERIVYQKR